MSEPIDDLSAVAWVHDELRRSLDAAHKALRRFGKEAEAVDGSDIDAVDPSVLRTARAQIHQGVGALELVGLPAPALVLRASEALVQRAANKPQTLTPAVIADIERASFALLDYLSRMLAGKSVSPLSLFPQYRAVQDMAEANRVHPADLWSVDWRWRELPADPKALPRQAGPAVHDALEGQLLALMRGTQPTAAARRIGDICAGLGAGASDPEVATLWKLASAVFEAQSEGLLGFDIYTKRVASRLLAQYRILERGESDVSERLARDLLFFSAQSAPPAAGQAPRLTAARSAYALPDTAPVDYSQSALGRFDPALIVHAKKRVTAAKEAWSAVAGGEMHRLAGLNEQFSLVGDSLKKLFPLGETFANELQQAVGQAQTANAAPPAALAMEVATGLLYTEAALEDGDFDDPMHAERIARLAERLAQVRQNHPPEPLEAWMEELYRRVSNRQTMGSVVQELRASLLEAEKSIDQFFRNPADRSVLVPVPQQLSAMRGVLSVLGIEHASAALLRMRDEIDALASTEVDADRGVQPGVFDRIAGNLSALGFLIDMLSVQPQMAKSLFTYDPEAGTLSPVMGRADDSEHMSLGVAVLAPAVEPRLLEQAQLLAFSSVRDDVSLQDVTRDLDRLSHEAQAADQPALAAAVLKAQEAFERATDESDIASARGELSEALVDFVATAAEPEPIAPAPSLAPRPADLPNVDISDFQEDDEMRGVFLEEAREVIADADSACKELARSSSDLALQTTLRRAFHTLKGSSRMVGLKDFGEAAWLCEQLYNTHLAEQRAAEPAFVEFTAWSLGYLGAWSDEIAAHGAVTHDVATLQARADAVGRESSGEAPSDIALPLGFPPDLPSAADLDLTMPLSSAPMPLPAPLFTSSKAAPLSDGEEGAAPFSADEAPAFELDLSALDAGGAGTPAGGFTTAQTHLNPSVQALFDPFDAFEPAAEPLPVPDTVDVEVDLDSIASGPMDLDLGGDETEPAFIRSLEPSRADAAPAAPEPADEAVGPGEASFALDLSDPEAASTALPLDDGASETRGADDELVKVVGPLRISIPLFNIYLNEADELSRRLATELAEWAMELERPVGETPIALAHSLAGSSATVGFADLSHLARALEHALTRSQAIGRGTAEEAGLFGEAAEEIRRVLHQFAAGFLREPSADVIERLARHELSSVARLQARTHAEEIAPDDDGDALPDPSLAGDETLAFEPLKVRQQAKEMREWRQPEPSGAGTRSDPDSVETTPADLDDAVTAPAPFDDAFEPAPGAPSQAPHAATAEPSPQAGLDEGMFDAGQTLPGPSAPADADADAAVRADTDAMAYEPAPVAAAFAPVASVHDVVAHKSTADEAWGAPLEAVPEAEPEPSADAPASTFGALPGRFDPLGLAELKPLGAMPQPTSSATVAQEPLRGAEDDIDAQDAVDAELFPIFEEEGLELIPQLASQLRDWIRAPGDGSKASACMRTLHTLKGGARLAGAMRLGEMAHRLETRIERILGRPPVEVADLDALQSACDALSQTLEALRRGADAAAAEPSADAAVAALVRPLAGRGEIAANDDGPAPVPAPVVGSSPPAPAPATPEKASAGSDAPVPSNSAGSIGAPGPAAGTRPAEGSPSAPQRSVPVAVPRAASPLRAAAASPSDQTPIDWSRFSVDRHARARPVERGLATSQAAVRVRVPLLDRLVNLAGEVSITRSRVESGVNQIKGSLNDLTENLERLRGQLRDIEIQGETQMTSRLEAAKAASQNFDPLEFDRFTRFQELTRMMAESVNDVGTLQRTLQRSIETTEDELVAQARMTRDLQDDLLRTRMVEFEGLSDRLYRVVRQAAKETGKQVRLDLVGGSIEIDRGVLDRMTGAFEHLLRNCVSHGIELPAERSAAGKDPVGSIVVSLAHEGNEVGIEFRDDGAGLDLERIRRKAIDQGLIEPGAVPTQAELANLIFQAGFTTVETVTELAGRGVGMDVVRSEVVAMGGRIETATEAGKGTSFRLILPLTTAVTQVVMLRCGETTVAVPSTLVETVLRATEAEIDEAYGSGSFSVGDKALQFFWLGALLQISARPDETAGRSRSVVVVRSAQQRIVVHVDEIVGNQEVVVKNLGPQLSRLPGLAGMTLLASGVVALIYNPVALATLYGEGARNATLAAYRPSMHSPLQPVEDEPPVAPLVLVVDDSLTVRRVTQRLLVREGYRVVLAKDGLDALERLAEEVPRIVLSDIEMPRMDGFDLVRNIRADARWRELPVIMITSRIAQKHREHAIELGVDHYLGKPYSEEDLLALIGRYTAAPART